MGNVKSSLPPLALIAVARKLTLQRCQIVSLRDALASFTDSDGYVDKQCFLSSLAKAHISSPDDVEIFELLFIMWDSKGIEKIPYKAFSVGVAVLACPHDDIVSILRFAMHIQDEGNTGMMCSKSLRRLLHCKYYPTSTLIN
jgi:Ca2+-binding EF-hand superfamily protein